jgi:hypothetical protein
MLPRQLDTLSTELKHLQRKIPLTKATESASAAAIPALHFWGEQLFCIGKLPTTKAELAQLFAETFARQELMNVRKNYTQNPFVFICFANRLSPPSEQRGWEDAEIDTDRSEQVRLPLDWFFQTPDPATGSVPLHELIDPQTRKHCAWTDNKIEAPSTSPDLGPHILAGEAIVNHDDSAFAVRRAASSQRAPFFLYALDRDATIELTDDETIGTDHLCELLSPTINGSLGFQQTLVLLDRTDKHEQSVQTLLIIEIARYHQFYFSRDAKNSAAKIYGLVQRLYDAFPGVQLTPQMIEHAIKSADALYDKYLEKLSRVNAGEPNANAATNRCQGHYALLAFEKKFFGNAEDARRSITRFQTHHELTKEQQSIIVRQFIQKWVIPTVLRVANSHPDPSIATLARRYFNEFRHPEATHPRVQCALLWSLFSCPPLDDLSMAIAERWQAVTGLAPADVTQQVMYMIKAFFRDNWHDNLNNTFEGMRRDLVAGCDFDEELRVDIQNAAAMIPHPRGPMGRMRSVPMPTSPGGIPATTMALTPVKGGAGAEAVAVDSAGAGLDNDATSPVRLAQMTYTPVRLSTGSRRDSERSESDDAEQQSSPLSTVVRSLFAALP